MAVSNQVRHVTEIEQVLDGQQSQRDATVVNSWIRCVSDYRLDPSQQVPAHIVSPQCLREHRQRNERLIHIARHGLNELFRQVAGHDYVLLLADNEGVTIDYFGDSRFESELRRAGLYLGAEWSEARAGTCGVGSCIVTGEALTIHQGDHFDSAHMPLSCTAAPIYNPDGHLAAVLDISLLRPPGPKISQNLALHLVRQSARHVELANLMHEQRRGWVLCFSRQPAFLDVDPEHAIALDADGRLVGMTHSACRELAALMGCSWRQPRKLLGQPISRFFQTDAEHLARLARNREPAQRMLLATDNSSWYARLQGPDWTPLNQSLSLPSRTRSNNAEPHPAFAELHWGDQRMAALLQQCSRVAKTNLPVLLQGETGTGKERLAQAIHTASGRPGAFVAVNCAAIPESLIEGELFGHAPGAFTGAASKGRAGLIESANGGTLFLDEIGDMPSNLQARLLRVLSEGEVLRVGATSATPLDIRVVSATLHNLESRMASGDFRNDLYHRLAGAEFWLPALREREDLLPLAQVLAQKHAVNAQLSPEVTEFFAQYAWPGNIRELDTTLRFALLLSDDHRLTLAQLPERLLRRVPQGLQRQQSCSIEQAIAECDGNVSAAARKLGVDRSTIYRHLRRKNPTN
ncbi:sigma-54-dependent Fis family transcriptional regulator [Halioxenophilus aromaticivorans]|uniref:Sigma-54-dependent Fis family transcriptional regulator n=1 Tax=Halioxenophilus aromaticivorans TaxID=1306992 RepID=A0AAV3U0C7_9ALTE